MIGRDRSTENTTTGIEIGGERRDLAGKNGVAAETHLAEELNSAFFDGGGFGDPDIVVVGQTHWESRVWSIIGKIRIGIGIGIGISIAFVFRGRRRRRRGRRANAIKRVVETVRVVVVVVLVKTGFDHRSGIPI